uniref:glucuronosyltransferase n=1 Tax=Strongyloides papillosus TaxID=174720 RepID=A0A0N5BVW4_STREA
MIKSVFIIYYFIQLLPLSETLKILVYAPKVGYSHLNFNGKIADVLVNAGHNVTFLSPKYEHKPVTNGTKLAKVITVEPHPYIAEIYPEREMMRNIWNSEDSVKNAVSFFSQLQEIFYTSCEHLIEQNELTEKMVNEQFDVMIAEYMTTCPFGLFKLYNVSSLVITSAMTLNDIVYPFIGLNFPSSYVPGSFMPFKDKMTYKERMINSMQYFALRYYLENILFDKYNQLFSKKLQNAFDITSINVGGVFVNTVPWLDFPFPTTPKVHFIGGSGVPEPKKLIKEWDELLSLRKINILISFGSVAESYKMPESYKKGILEMMKNFEDVTFIWKYEKDPKTLPIEVPKNTFIYKWIPQNDLLNDDRLTIFITHGGLNSITEAVTRGKVTLTIPVFGDQIRNAQMVERLNISKVFSKKQLGDSKLLTDAINYLLSNIGAYSKNAHRQQSLMKNRPFTAEETIVRVTEFLGKHGNIPEMDLYGKEMSSIVFYNLDIIIPGLFILFTLIGCIMLLLKNILELTFKSKEKNKVD